MAAPPRRADSCARMPVQVMFAAWTAFGYGVLFAEHRLDQAVGQVRVRAAVAAALDERQVLLVARRRRRPWW